MRKPDIFGIKIDISKAYEKRVQALEAEGCTRSDAQGIVDMEAEQGDFTHWDKTGYVNPEAFIKPTRWAAVEWDNIKE